MDELRQTALFGEHETLGAKMVDFAGWSMPVWYDSATAEHHAVRQSAGIFDLGHMGELIVSGPDSAAALSYALVLDATPMPVGRARYTMMCADDGGIIDDLIVYRLDDDRFMVVANASNAGVVAAELVRRTETYDAVVDDDTERWALIAVQGPESAAIVGELLSDLVLDDIRYYRIDQTTWQDTTALVARTGYTGEDGFELYVGEEVAVPMWRALIDVGGDWLTPCGLACRDTLRLEAGMPLYGNELSTERTPYDVGSARLIKLDGPDFVGKAALAEAAEQPQRFLAGLQIEHARPARAGYAVQLHGETIGSVTSGALSPTLGYPIAMADLGIELAVGAAVTVDLRGKPAPAKVVALPFYARSDR